MISYFLLLKYFIKYWPPFVQIRCCLFRGLAHYHKGQAVHAEDKYGEEVAWLSIAATCVNDQTLAKLLKAQPISLQQQFQSKSEIIINAYRVAYNDNTKIYHELVPKELPTLEMKAMVAATVADIPTPDSKNDPFRGLVSKQAMETCGMYKVRVSQPFIEPFIFILFLTQIIVGTS